MKLIEMIWIVAAVGWVTWAFDDGAFYIMVFVVGFLLGQKTLWKCRDNEPSYEQETS